MNAPARYAYLYPNDADPIMKSLWAEHTGFTSDGRPLYTYSVIGGSPATGVLGPRGGLVDPVTGLELGIRRPRGGPMEPPPLSGQAPESPPGSAGPPIALTDEERRAFVQWCQNVEQRLARLEARPGDLDVGRGSARAQRRSGSSCSRRSRSARSRSQVKWFLTRSHRRRPCATAVRRRRPAPRCASPSRGVAFLDQPAGDAVHDLLGDARVGRRDDRQGRRHGLENGDGQPLLVAGQRVGDAVLDEDVRALHESPHRRARHRAVEGHLVVQTERAHQLLGGRQERARAHVVQMQSLAGRLGGPAKGIQRQDGALLGDHPSDRQAAHRRVRSPSARRGGQVDPVGNHVNLGGGQPHLDQTPATRLAHGDDALGVREAAVRAPDRGLPQHR